MRPLPLSCAIALLASQAAGEGEVQGDIEYGEYLSSECVTCHKTGDNGGIPPIGGWAAADFVVALYDFKTGARKHEVMELIARSLGKEEIDSLAVYFESRGH